MAYQGNLRVVALSADPAGTYSILGGQTSLSDSREREDIDVATKVDDFARTLPGQMSGSLSFESYEQEAGDPAQDALELCFREGRLVYVEEGSWSGTGNIADSYTPVKRNTGYITSIEREAAMNEAVTLSVEVNLQANWTIVSGLAVSPASASIAVGGTQQLAVTDSGGVDRTPQAAYSSSDTAVATVDAAGLVSGVAAGFAVISATYNNMTATSDITVA